MTDISDAQKSWRGKSVSFDPNLAPDQPLPGVVVNPKASYLSEVGYASRDSNSGYVADSATEGTQKQKDYYGRLYRFYEKYNPQKLDRVHDYLASYRGEEEQLFAILVGKYGPEPDSVRNGATNNNASILSSEESVMHYSGKRCRIPKRVGPQEGFTDCETPYWAGVSAPVSDRDLLQLLQTFETPNVELQKCYMGFFKEHPGRSWNGLTYVTRTEGIAPPGVPFLGHIWAGTLGSRKVLIHEGRKYHRVTLYCTDDCQTGSAHERWRLSVYRGDSTEFVLIRVIWDPVIVQEALPPSRSNLSEHEIYSSSDAIPTRLSSKSSDASSARQPLQPEQPVAVANPLLQLTQLLERMESRINGRLDVLEQRLGALEAQKLLGTSPRP